MSEINDGGPAFPVEWKTFNGGLGGMSLRDWFAGQALAGLLANTECHATPEGYASDAYMQADAMLKAKEVSDE